MFLEEAPVLLIDYGVIVSVNKSALYRTPHDLLYCPFSIRVTLDSIRPSDISLSESWKGTSAADYVASLASEVVTVVIKAGAVSDFFLQYV